MLEIFAFSFTVPMDDREVKFGNTRSYFITLWMHVNVKVKFLFNIGEVFLAKVLQYTDLVQS